MGLGLGPGNDGFNMLCNVHTTQGQGTIAFYCAHPCPFPCPVQLYEPKGRVFIGADLPGKNEKL